MRKHVDTADRLLALRQRGQSVWLDSISRGLVSSGELRHYVERDGISGVTTNPTIFAKALASGSEYDDAIRRVVEDRPGISNAALAERLMIEDIQMAADVLRPVFDRTQGADGFVSLEVSPACAGNTEATVAETRRLWFDIARLNAMIKIPATPAGIPAIEALLVQGININITLMFSMAHYDAVAKAYLRALAGQRSPHQVASVASLFISRVDAVVDPLLDAVATREAARLRGRVALANARRIYRRFVAITEGDTFSELRRRGARAQRLLWASTATKDVSYSDVRYLEGLAAPDTVTTVPPATLAAFRDHGTVTELSFESAAGDDDATLAGAAALGIDLATITEQLQAEGVAAFARSYDHLLAALEDKRIAVGDRESRGEESPARTIAPDRWRRASR